MRKGRGERASRRKETFIFSLGRDMLRAREKAAGGGLLECPFASAQNGRKVREFRLGWPRPGRERRRFGYNRLFAGWKRRACQVFGLCAFRDTRRLCERRLLRTPSRETNRAGRRLFRWKVRGGLPHERCPVVSRLPIRRTMF